MHVNEFNIYLHYLVLTALHYRHVHVHAGIVQWLEYVEHDQDDPG